MHPVCKGIDDIPCLISHRCGCCRLQALKEVEALRAQVANYDTDKMALSQGKARLSQAHKQVKNLEWENEVGCNVPLCVHDAVT